ncbi:HPr family phosphocarrier protein [Defluviitalea phaphyphila]|uniref:HPr family phosphocarrier protein n=1 Tax=Defluviitalea phaphyphila TaxID=1473580 RepID=UPI00073147E7|nr:HPr family phosphocarrier protein [Defluviitalea phaphyphila]
MIKKTVTLINEQGLHARPAQLLAAEAMKYKCELQLIKNDDNSRICNPKSILSIMSMGAAKGDKITITADGLDEEKALKALAELIENGFGE